MIWGRARSRSRTPRTSRSPSTELVAAARAYARMFARVPGRREPRSHRVRRAPTYPGRDGCGDDRPPDPSPRPPPQGAAARRARGRPDAALRVRVTAGGCSGFSYELSFEDAPADDDHVITAAGGFRVLIDPRERADRAGLHARLRRRPDGRRPEDGEPAGHARVRLRRLVQRLSASVAPAHADLQACPSSTGGSRSGTRSYPIEVHGDGHVCPGSTASSTLPSSSVNVWSAESAFVIVDLGRARQRR